MTTHSQHNNVEAAAAASDHNKRVSFGAEEHVQMIVYDDGINDDYSIGQNNRHHQQQQTARHTFTEPDAPPSRVRVHAEQAEVPRPISPPAQLAPVMMDMTAAHSSTSSAGGNNNAISASAPALQMINSPPLPSFARREDNSDNPFRPDEQLYHEVDPIVEMYRQRPFPPSPTHSPVPPHQQQQQQQQTPSRTTPSRSGVANGGGSAGGGGGGRHSSLAEARREANQTHPAELADSAAAADGLLGPPGRAEVVRMPDKKKRACCSLQ